ncbi:MAG: glycosyltransferase family 39 protein [bacterium]
MTSALLGLLIPTGLLYWALTPAEARRQPALRALFVGLAMTLASGLTSCLWFLGRIGLDAGALVYFASETALLLLLVWWRPRLAVPTPPAASPLVAASTALRFAVPILALLGLSWLTSMVIQAVQHPHGSWDGVAIWNLHAHYLAAGSARWGALCRQGDVCAYHADYPLLVPAAVARLWSLAGGANTTASPVIGAWWSAALVVVCGGAVATVRGANQGLLAAATLLGTGLFVRQSGTQCADVPLALYMTTALAAYALHDASGRRGHGWLVLAGLCAGLAAWTKNEGVLFVGLFSATHLALSMRRHGWRATLRDSVALAVGLLPGLYLVAYLKIALAPVNDLVAGQGAEATLARLVDVGRYATVLVGMTRALVRVGKGLLIALPVYYLLMGTTRLAVGHATARFALVVSGLMLAAYCGVYLLTPQPLAWHLSTSAARVVLQLWPGTVLGLFLLLAAPEEQFPLSSQDQPAA